MRDASEETSRRAIRLGALLRDGIRLSFWVQDHARACRFRLFAPPPVDNLCGTAAHSRGAVAAWTGRGAGVAFLWRMR